MTATEHQGSTNGTTTPPDRNLALDLVRVTEAAALAAGRWVGRGDKEAADQAAVDAMRLMLGTVNMAGVVVIGEGEKDKAPMLYNGEEVGSGQGPEVDVAVDPLEGTRLTALGQPNAIAVIALAERGTMFFPGAAFYMDKIACGADGRRGDRHHGAAGGERAPRRRGEGHILERRLGRRARTPAARAADRAAARLRRAREPDPRRRRRPVDRGSAARDRGGPADGHRRHAGGRDLGGRREVARRRAPGPAVAARRRGAREAGRRRLRPGEGAHDATTSSRATTSSSRPRA